VELGSWLRERGWTLAGVILAGVVLFALLDFIHSTLCFGASVLVNATSTASAVATRVAQATASTEVVSVGQYRAAISTLSAEGEGLTFVSKVHSASAWLLKQLLKLVSSRELFTAILVLGFAIAVYERLVGEG